MNNTENPNQGSGDDQDNSNPISQGPNYLKGKLVDTFKEWALTKSILEPLDHIDELFADPIDRADFLLQTADSDNCASALPVPGCPALIAAVGAFDRDALPNDLRSVADKIGHQV